MVPFTVEEENLICMYHKSDRRRTAANIRAALPDMDEDMAAPGPPDRRQAGRHARRRL